jgi:hypothetical protein
MKNLFFAFALILVGTFTFASNVENKSYNEITTSDNSALNVHSLNFNSELMAMECFDFYDSCGGAWEVCHEGVSTGELVAFLWEWDGGC